MDKAVIAYKKRRQDRLDARLGKQVDSVEEFKKRRAERLDAGVGWAYGLAKSRGIDTEGMTPKEVFEALKEKGGAPKLNKNAPGGKGKKSAETKSFKKTNFRKKSAVRNHECDGTGYKGKPGEVKTGRGGALTAKSDAAKKIGCGDAKAEVDLFIKTGGKKGRKYNSLTEHIDKNGNLSPERQRVHDEIVQKVFADLVPYKGKATMTMSGGGPASGKSFIEKSLRKKFGDETTLTVDPDKIKEYLPGYTEMAIQTDDAAGHYHEESSALAKRIYQYALDNNINVVYDGTGDGSVNSVKKKIDAARKAGYAVNGEYVTVDVDSPTGALYRNQKRYEKGLKEFQDGTSDVPPRKPKEEHVRSIHSDVSDIFPQIANLYDNLKLWDNNQAEGEPRTLIATCKRGGDIKCEKSQESLLNKFLAKGKAGYKYAKGKISD